MTPATELDRLFSGALSMCAKPEAPMPYDRHPDFGNPDQHKGEPTPLDFDLTPKERHDATIAKIDLERKRREANKRDADRDLVKLGVVFTDDGPEAA